MERESFENVEIAQQLNRNFVSIKVDREERPDVDKVYMTFVQVSLGALDGQLLGSCWYSWYPDCSLLVYFSILTAPTCWYTLTAP